MTNTYTKAQQDVLAAVIEILKEKNGHATLDEIYQLLPAKTGKDMDEKAAADVLDIIQTSSAETCIFLPGETRCLYVTDQGNGDYVLEENKEAAKGSADDATAGQPGRPAGEAPVKPEAEPDLKMATAGDATAVVEPYQSVPADEKEKPGTGVEDPALKIAEEAADNFDYDEAKMDALKDKDDEAIVREEAGIEKEKEKIAHHEEQIAHDRTGFMKDIHEMEIRHDKKVIAGKEAEIIEKEAEKNDLQ